MALLLGSIDGRGGWDRLREIDRAGEFIPTPSWAKMFNRQLAVRRNRLCYSGASRYSWSGGRCRYRRLPTRSLGVRLAELCHSFGGVGRFHVAAGGGLDLHDGVDADTVSDC